MSELVGKEWLLKGASLALAILAGGCMSMQDTSPVARHEKWAFDHWAAGYDDYVEINWEDGKRRKLLQIHRIEDAQLEKFLDVDYIYDVGKLSRALTYEPMAMLVLDEEPVFLENGDQIVRFFSSRMPAEESMDASWLIRALQAFARLSGMNFFDDPIFREWAGDRFPAKLTIARNGNAWRVECTNTSRDGVGQHLDTFTFKGTNITWDTRLVGARYYTH